MLNNISSPSSIGTEIAIANSSNNPFLNFKESTLMDRLISPILSPEEHLVANSEVEEVFDRLGTLGIYFDLHYMQGHTIKEASEIMQIPERTFKRRLRMGKDQFLLEDK